MARKAGDLIFFESDGSPQDVLIRLVSKKYTHIGVLTEDTNRMIDASALGVRERAVPQGIPHLVMRINGATEAELAGIIEDMRSHIGERYSFFGAVFAGVLRLVGLKSMSRRFDNIWFCSEIVVHAARKRTSIDLANGFTSDNVFPSDLVKDKNLEEVIDG